MKVKSLISFLILSTFFLVAKNGFSQGNLQFNQVVNIVVPQNTSVAFNLQSGKVWKIESCGVGGPSSTSLIMRDAGNAPIGYLAGASNNMSFPFWIQGPFDGFFQSTGTNPYKDIVSIIEFNVVP